MDDKKEERLSKDIDEISRNIRKKYRALKLGIQESDDLLSKSLQTDIRTAENDFTKVRRQQTTACRNDKGETRRGGYTNI